MSSPLRNINDSLVTVSPVFLDTLQVWRIIELEGGRLAAAPDTQRLYWEVTQYRFSSSAMCWASL